MRKREDYYNISYLLKKDSSEMFVTGIKKLFGNKKFNLNIALFVETSPMMDEKFSLQKCLLTSGSSEFSKIIKEI